MLAKSRYAHQIIKNIAYNPFINEVRKRLTNGTDVVILVVGERRKGKSIASVKLAETIDPGYKVGEFPANKNTENFFTIPEFLNALAERELDGKVVTLQEMGVAAYRRNFAKEVNKTFNTVMQVIGYKRLCFIWTLPSLSFLDKHAVAMAHFILQAEFLDRRTGIAFFKVKRVEHDPITGKTYIKNYRFDQPGKVRPSVLSLLGLGKPKQFEAYITADTKFKDYYIKDVRDRGTESVMKAERKAKREMARDAKEGLE